MTYSPRPFRHWTPLLTAGLLALTLSIGLAPDALAKKKAKAPQQSEQTAPTAEPLSTKGKSHLAPKPVLDEATLKEINESSRQLDANTRAELNRLSDALHLEDRGVYNELRDDEETAISNLGMLWQAAVEHNGTIRYAIEKLSRRDATGKPVSEDNFSKRMIGSLVHLGGVASSMWAQNPAGVVGSNMIQDLMRGSPDESALSRVTDADMVIIAKEVESLQSQLIELYHQYVQAKERLDLAQEASETIGRAYDHAMSAPPSAANEALQPTLQSMYELTKQDEQKAQQAFSSARTALALVVGPEAIAALEEKGGLSHKNKAAAATPSLRGAGVFVCKPQHGSLLAPGWHWGISPMPASPTLNPRALRVQTSQASTFKKTPRGVSF